MTRTVLLLSLSLSFALAVPAHAGQWVTPKPPKDAPVATPAAPVATAPAPAAATAAECQKLKADLDALEAANPLARDDSRTVEGARSDGGIRTTGPRPNQALKDARDAYAARCGTLPGTPKSATAAAAPIAPVAPQAAQPAQTFPKKAGPAKGTGSSPERCAQLHQSMKDALARQQACAKNDNRCRKHEQDGYQTLRNAYRSGCGDIPADAKPGKGKGR